MNVLVFAGAGSSVELGIPAMFRMAEDFRRHVQQWGVEVDLVSRLMPEGVDIEDLIERLDQICGASEPLQSLGQDGQFADSARSVQAEVEWYVQHACERLSPEQAILQWGSLLEMGSLHSLIVATTNYDRAIELAANGIRIDLVDGFASFGQGEVAAWTGFLDATQPFSAAGVSLLKLHGSTDWYEQMGAGIPVKLRHPMPLFAHAELHIPSIQDALSSSLILPSREKRVTRPPYTRLTQIFLNSVDRADLAVFLGSSLRDPHIKQAALESSRVRPTFLVNRTPSADPSFASLTQISQSASRFLISTLPQALASADPIVALKESAQAAQADDRSVLPALTRAMDESLSASERCGSIESLESMNVHLERRLVESLLRDEDSSVAKFGLGMIPLAIGAASLVDVAREVGSSRPDPDFGEELVLLEQLME